MRIATGDRDETPQWWAPRADAAAGIAKGLWPGEVGGSNRVFYSTSDKASSHTLSVELAKLTPHFDASGKNLQRPSKNAWNPELLELTMIGFVGREEAEQWAMYLHQQRFCDDYRDALGLPLILHIAKLTSEYALPHEDEEDAAVDDTHETPEAETSTQVEPT